MLASTVEPTIIKEIEVVSNGASINGEAEQNKLIGSSVASDAKSNTATESATKVANDNENDEDQEEDGEDLIEENGHKPVFEVVRRKDGESEIVELRIHDASMVQIIQGQGVKSETLYSDPPIVRSEDLFTILPQLRKLIIHELPLGENENVFCDDKHKGKRGLVKLVHFLETEHKASSKIINKMIKEGKISFKYLWFLFSVGSYGFAEQQGVVKGFVVDKVSYQHTYFSTFFVVSGKSIDCDGTHFKFDIQNYYINSFDDVALINSLTVQPLEPDSEVHQMLTKRGEQFEKHALGNSYIQYSGKMFREGWFGPVYFKAEGRVMIDVLSFAQMNSNYSMGVASTKSSIRNRYHNDLAADFQKMTKVPANFHFICSPTLYGFSFVAKKWGQLFVSDVSAIKFDDHAFERLVLEPERKSLILNLVNSGPACNLDLINGKGGGMIFLLHGTPGVGKTLTGESVAEHLHRPLYSVSAGELGTDVVSLEKKLSEILEVASVWHAVILIDEADIFLEGRSENDIHRNALVGIFLRLLEYHQGILFLTTNRVQCFDQAFKSRITLALKYDNLDVHARAQIWKTFLDRSEGAGNWNLDVEELSEAGLNGREIKNVVRLSKAMAGNNVDPITMANVRKVLTMMKNFDEEVYVETEGQHKRPKKI
ncbi:hypothetical protein HK100_012514 [Physocladia obscura]|uniref:AAA+ ATPase domain-containing protein n=1 Tax=Physocladia obscura TaxID=109957 RepID=A0AAD5XCF1_9FUNG|nr:hypothetical protein HK100_012514 [Physocladia obscura]